MGDPDKTMRLLGEEPMLARVLRALEPGQPVAISANGDPARFCAFGRPVLPDGEGAGRGPLAGLLAGLRWAAGLGAGTLLTVPGDTPFLPPGLAARLAPAPARAQCNGRLHPLVALWPVSVEASLAGFIRDDPPWSVRRFGDAIAMRDVVFEAAGGDPFLNVNTPGDLADAAERLRQQARGC